MTLPTSPLLTTNYRDHLIVACLLGVWLYLFLAVVGPFDAAELSLWVRMQLMVGYGFIFMLVYLACIPVQNWIYQKVARWNGWLESGFLLLFSCLCLPASYLYYTTDWVRGDYGFPRFCLEVYVPTLVILLPALALTRRFMARRRAVLDTSPAARLSDEWLSISGTNKLDILRLRPKQLIAVSAANNYITVYYQEDGSLRKKLLRTSLKKVQEQLPMLVRVHRSHLIHPLHFRAWKDASTLSLTHLEIPVAQSYKAALLDQLKFRPSDG